MAPTPFSADQIRAACPDGHTVTVRSTRAGFEAQRVERYTEGDAEGVTIWVEGQTASTRRRTTWKALQMHAAFPEDATTISDETIDCPLGVLECKRYDVMRRSGPATFWFAADYPGMPVRYIVAGIADEVISITRT